MTKFNYKHRVTIAGHRGDPKAVPENTIASFRSSVEKGCFTNPFMLNIWENNPSYSAGTMKSAIPRSE